MNSYFPGPADHVPAELVRDFDIFELPPGIEDPLLKWGELLEPGTPPIIYTPRNGGHWIFLDYEDIREAYRNDNLFSNYQTPIPPLEPYPVMQPQGVDPPEHKKFRSLLAPLFTPIAVKRMEEELLRINAVSNIYRRVKQDMSFRGIRMKCNDRVVLPNNIANRNASVFANPTVIDLERVVNTHLSFGAGPHRCIGSHLAKAEIMIALQEWLRRIPDFSLQPGVVIEAYLGPVMGMRNLPLIWRTE